MSPGPLDGLRALNLGVNVPAPVAAARLRRLGAEVVKVEPPAGDPLEQLAPGWYAELTAGMRVARLDLKAPGDRARLDAELARCDVLITSSRPAALARLGLGWEDLRDRFGRLVQVAIVGHPRPRHDEPGHDLTYLAGLGLLAPPQLPRTLVADLAGAERAVSAALGLLLARERGRAERYAEVALSEAAAAFAAPLRHGLTAEGGVVGGGLPAYGIYEARGGWVAVAAIEPHFQQRLRDGLRLDRLDADALARAFRERTPDDWAAWARERDIPLEAVAAGGGS